MMNEPGAKQFLILLGWKETERGWYEPRHWKGRRRRPYPTFEEAWQRDRKGASKMIHYLKGDATNPQGDGPKIIAHICNDIGGWGAGFVVAISRRWPEPEEAYRAWAKGRFKPKPGCAIIGPQNFALGSTQFVTVAPQLAVANMIAQRGYGPRGSAPHRTDNEDEDRPPIRYEALALCLQAVNSAAAKLGATVHMPRIGCGLAGGKWERVEPLIEKMLGSCKVYVYDLEAKRAV